MKKTGKKNRKKPVILLLLLLLFGMFFWGLYIYSSEENHEKVEHNNTETTTKPTPTKGPDAALPTLWMNGKLYKVDPLDESVVAYEEEDYVTIVSEKFNTYYFRIYEVK